MKTKYEELREEFIKKEWQHWSSAQSKFVRLPDSCKMEIANYWLKIRREAIADTTKQIEEFAHKEMKDGNLAYEKLLILLSSIT